MNVTRTLVEYLDHRLGQHSGNGPEYRWFCPACIDRQGSESNKPKLNINTTLGIGHCYRCGYKFRQFEALFRMLNNGPLKIEEARLIRKEVKLVSNVAEDAVRETLRPQRVSTPKLQRVPLPSDMLVLARETANPLARRAVRYLTNRGITPQQIDQHQIGFCTSGRYAGYLVFPVWQEGTQVYFTTRFAGTATDGRKSNNPPKAEGFHGKSTCLLNYDAVVGKKLIAVVEGPFDMMAWGDRAVALMGKDVSDAQIALLDRLCRSGTQEVVVSLDSDAGKYAQKIYERLMGRVPKVSVLLLPDGDPHDNRDRLDDLLSTRGAPNAVDLVRSRYRLGALVKRAGKSYVQRA